MANLPPRPRPASHRVIATPYAKKLAKELGVDLSTIGGTGPAGRITAADVEAAKAGKAPAAPAPAAAAPTPAAAPGERVGRAGCQVGGAWCAQWVQAWAGQPCAALSMNS